jgi:hypothetical protein
MQGDSRIADQGFRKLEPADAPAFRLDEHGLRSVQRRERGEELALEHLLRRLRIVGQIAQQRAAMLRKAFEIQHLSAFGGNRLDQPRFAGSRQAADDAKPELLRRVREHQHDVPAIRAIPAVELHCAKADFGQHVHERTAALPTAPAVDERRPVARFVARVRFANRRDIACDECGAHLARVESRVLDVHRANERSLRVVEHGEIDGPGQVVFRIFAGRPHIDPLAIRRPLRGVRHDGGAQRWSGWQWRAHLRDSNGTSDGHTLSRMRGCAAATGWIRSP